MIEIWKLINPSHDYLSNKLSDEQLKKGITIDLVYLTMTLCSKSGLGISNLLSINNFKKKIKYLVESEEFEWWTFIITNKC